jgi:acyl-CoA reductase-like NAD-dependent aldehyde dehydrogenase
MLRVFRGGRFLGSEFIVVVQSRGEEIAALSPAADDADEPPESSPQTAREGAAPSQCETRGSDGAEAVVGGGRYGDRGFFMQPTILTNTNPNMKVERWINTYHVFDAAMPFGGYEESGWSRKMGHQVLNNYLETKSVVTAL